MAPLRGTKAGIKAEDNPIEDSNKRVCQGQGGDMLGYPQGLLFVIMFRFMGTDMQF